MEIQALPLQGRARGGGRPDPGELPAVRFGGAVQITYKYGFPPICFCLSWWLLRHFLRQLGVGTILSVLLIEACEKACVPVRFSVGFPRSDRRRLPPHGICTHLQDS